MVISYRIQDTKILSVLSYDKMKLRFFNKLNRNEL